MLQRMWSRLAESFGIGGRSRTDRLHDDAEAFVAMLTDEHIARGMAPDAARRAAVLEAEASESAREAVRDEEPRAWLRPLTQDARYAMRLMRRTPGLTLAVMAAIALGIGATTTTFSAVDAVLLRPLPYANADRLVVVLHRGTNPVSAANFLDWQRGTSASFEAMGAAEYWSPNLRGAGSPEKLTGLRLTPEILPMLGVQPAIGRWPAGGAGSAREVVLSDALWRRDFGADPRVLGRALVLDTDTDVVVGVMPATFHFAPFWATHAELWSGLDLAPRASQRGSNSLRVFAKLRERVPLARAQANVTAVTGALEAQFPGSNRNVTVTPLKDRVVGDVRPTLLVLFGAVACVLLLACANVAYLLLARAAAREREFAVRCAIGASRARVIRQLLTESVVLSVTGGVLGVALATLGVRAFTGLAAESVPRLQGMTIDARVLAFATVLSVLTGLVFGLAPARTLSRLNVNRGLREDDRGATSGRASRNLRRLLVASQVALVFVLLAGAGLLLRSFAALRTQDLGFAPEGIASFVVSVSGSSEAEPGRRLAFYNDVMARVRAMPGVESAAAINHMPLVGDIWGFPYVAFDRPQPKPEDRPSATYRVVSPGYFETMRIAVEGRTFTNADRIGAPPVVIVNHALAASTWPAESAIGKRLRVPFGDDQDWCTVVGVSRDTVRTDLHDVPEPEMFLPLEQNHAYQSNAAAHYAAMTLVVRARSDAASLVPAFRAAVHEAAPDVPVSEVSLLQEAVDRGADGARFTMALLGTFALVALTLASVGIFGVMSHDVAGRRREIGIRLALGASRGRVVGGVIRDGLLAAVSGLACGFAAAWVLRTVVEGLLFRIAPLDPATFAIATAMVATVATLGCLLPAWRGSRMNVGRELK